MVDDHIPCYKWNDPYFVSSKQKGEVWPCLLEKAWAKIIGSYARVESGHPGVAA